MQTIPYDDLRILFRVYESWECDPDPKEGYPFIWPKISGWVRRYSNDECLFCGHAYRSEGEKLDVHHWNHRKDDCRRENLVAACRPCHMTDHAPPKRYKDCYCPLCKGWFAGWGQLRRHILGKHGVEGLEKYRRRRSKAS